MQKILVKRDREQAIDQLEQVSKGKRWVCLYHGR